MATSTVNAALISSVEELKSFISTINSSHKLYVDIMKRGPNHGGGISLLTILVHPQKVIKVIDVLALGRVAFTAQATDGKSLKSILGAEKIKKHFWDVRHAADAMKSHSSVISSVLDIQLLELASREGDKTHVTEFSNAIQSDLRSDTTASSHSWIFSERVLEGLMETNILSERPLDTTIIEYCENKIARLSDLHAVYLDRINPVWLSKAETESGRRLARVRNPENDPNPQDKTLGPWAPCGRTILSFDEMLDVWENERMDALAEDDNFDFYDHAYDDDDFYDDYDEDDWPTSCRDIISDSDMHLYYSD